MKPIVMIGVDLPPELRERIGELVNRAYEEGQRDAVGSILIKGIAEVIAPRPTTFIEYDGRKK